MKQVITILIILSTLNSFSQTVAFPCAKGAGATATGGRGGSVLHVTNLNWDNNPGSLKWAIEQNYTRTIVFDVSGTIKVPSQFYDLDGQQYSNMTIAGQTAPEGGITIEHNWFSLSNMSNIIIRYIRFVHVGYFYSGGPVNSSAFSFNITGRGVLDHISTRYSWNSVALGSRNNSYATATEGVSIQHSIFGDCKTGMLVGPGATDPVLVNNYSSDYSVNNNLFAHISHRFPNATGNGRFDIVNNVVYNPSARLNTIFNNAKVNMIGNFYKDGPHFNLSVNKVATYIDVPSPPEMLIYTENNIVEHTNYLKTDTSWTGLFVEWAGNSGNDAIPPNEASHRQLSQFSLMGGLTAIDVDLAYADVLSDVGANKYLNEDGTYGTYLDTVDQQYITETTNGTGTYKDLSNVLELTYPTLPNNTRPAGFYNTNPHIPEVWFLVNVPSGQNHNDIAPSGYTWLEEFLNRVDNCQSNTTGIKLQEQESLTIYPNPTIDELIITSNNEITKVELYSSLGSLVLSKDKLSSKTQKLNIANLPKGVYSIKVYESNRTIEKQIIKQ